MKDYVYFPDLCFLQLLCTTNSGLYDWVEEYLSERSVVEAGDGHVSKEEQEALVDSLEQHLKRYFPAKAHSAYTLGQWVPGISGGLTEHPVTLFARTGPQESAMQTAGKRLSSQAYWRYYFAFSAPQNVLPPQILSNSSRSPASLKSSRNLRNACSVISRARTYPPGPGLNTSLPN